jgi:hypothetical protein
MKLQRSWICPVRNSVKSKEEVMIESARIEKSRSEESGFGIANFVDIFPGLEY